MNQSFLQLGSSCPPTHPYKGRAPFVTEILLCVTEMKYVKIKRMGWLFLKVAMETWIIPVKGFSVTVQFLFLAYVDLK